MFEEIVENNFLSLKSITDTINEISLDVVLKSDLPEFTKSFITEETEEINDRETLENLIEKSIKLNLNFALRSKWTLLNYIFGNFDSKPAEEVIRKSSIFSFYKFYCDLIANYTKENNLVFITQSRVKDLIEETNNVLYEKLTKNITGTKIKNFFLQVYNLKLQNEAELNLDTTVPFLYIRLFLEDKNFPLLTDKFNVIPDLSDSSEIDLKSLIKILTDKYKFDTEPETKEVIHEISENNIIAEETVQERDTIKFIKNIPLKKPAETENLSDEEKFTGNETIKIITDVDTESHENVKIKRIFSDDELSSIRKKVFKGSRTLMHNSFKEIEKIKNWKEATGYLKELFKKNKVDKYNKYVIIFVDQLSDFFNKNEKD